MTLLAAPETEQAASQPSGRAIVATIMAKDAVAFSRNRFIMFITVLVLVVWAVVYQFLPTTVDETFPIGVVVEEGSLDPELLQGLQLDALGGPQQQSDGATTGVAVTVYPSRTELEQAVDTGDDITAGLVIPSGFTEDLQIGAAEVILVVPAGLQPQYESLLESAAQEIGYALTGQAPPVDLTTLYTMQLLEQIYE